MIKKERKKAQEREEMSRMGMREGPVDRELQWPEGFGRGTSALGRVTLFGSVTSFGSG